MTNQSSTLVNQRVVVVLGMDRSGTSAITRGLNALGIGLGDKLLGPAPINQKGFWEDTDIVALNKTLLDTLGLRWDSLSVTYEQQWNAPSLNYIRQSAIDLIRRNYGSSPAWGFKDPRTVAVLPFWMKIFSDLGIEDSYVICFRNPYSVASSLSSVPAGPSLTKCYLMWLEKSILAIMRTEGKMRIVVDYDRVMDSPLREMKRIARRLKIPIDEETEATLVEYSENFISADLRHSVHTVEDLSNAPSVPLPDFISNVAYRLQRLGRDQDSFDEQEYMSEWKKIWHEFEQLAAVFGYVDDVEDERNRIWTELQSRIKELEGGKAWLEEQYKRLNETIKRLNGTIYDQKRVIEEQKQWTEKLEQGKAWLERQYHNYERYLSDLRRNPVFRLLEKTAVLPRYPSERNDTSV